MQNNFYDCIIIGGGAAGMIAAVTAADNGKSVLLIEKGEKCGRKLAITGKGRCNVTNNCTDEDFFANIPVNSRFLYSAYSRFNCQDCMDFFEACGVPLKTERGNRVFPVSDNAHDIVHALEKACRDRGVQIHKGEKVKNILVDDGIVTGVDCGDTIYNAVSVLVATGGKSYPGTGSDGDGYRFAEKLGHTIVPLKPSLVPLVAEESYCTEMMGL